MNYEKELGYLKRELKKSTEKYDEAVAEGHERYAEIWSDDIVDIKHQIHIYEQATKADKYEAKAKAFGDSLKWFKELQILHEEVMKVSQRNQVRAEVYKEILSEVIEEMESNLEESGGIDE